MATNGLNGYLGFHEAVLAVRSTRQQYLAANIANADTPNYKARDINFADSLKHALAKTSDAPSLTTTSSLHYKLGENDVMNNPNLLYRNPMADSVDGNTVEMDVERAQFAENSIRLEAGINFMSGKIKSLLSVIQG